MRQDILPQFRDPDLCRRLVERISRRLQTPFRFMEVCGTHTVAIFQSGLRSIFPAGLEHVTGPGCPVCVTHAREVAACIELAMEPRVVLATFGDMLRVPDARGRSLKTAKAQGADVRICYSPFEALELAHSYPDREIVFLGIGFETTAPTVAATLKQARDTGLGNFSLLSCHKLVPPALRHLVRDTRIEIHGFLLPGHVSTVIGSNPYRFLAEEFATPAVVGGFEPLDILQSLDLLLEQRASSHPRVDIQYTRAVSQAGNRKAQQVLQEVFDIRDGLWRGLGWIPESALALKESFAHFDALRRFHKPWPEAEEPPGCRCGRVLQGLERPRSCPLFGSACTPSSPVGPCMVSSEGSCAAEFYYG